jgi:uncharacterized protein (TIGR03066 family)
VKTLRLTLAGMIAVIVTVQVGAVEKAEKPDYAKLIVGKWEVTKVGPEGVTDLPMTGAVYEFSKEGKMKVTAKKDGKDDSHELDYKIIDNQLQPFAGEKKGPPSIIRKITDKELILEGKGTIKIEFKRIP